MNKWEYRTVDWGEIRKIGSRITGEDFIDANVDAGLNSLGQDGWEMVNANENLYIFKRPADLGGWTAAAAEPMPTTKTETKPMAAPKHHKHHMGHKKAK